MKRPLADELLLCAVIVLAVLVMELFLIRAERSRPHRLATSPFRDVAR